VLAKVLSTNGFVVDSYDDPVVALENFNPDLYDLVMHSNCSSNITFCFIVESID
jgi:hypothetical protein